MSCFCQTAADAASDEAVLEVNRFCYSEEKYEDDINLHRENVKSAVLDGAFVC
ncbi:hypothetical protein HMPREF0880_02581 [Yokenella regensburgei ATCC 43003]|nr:hypothetical protein HMPREF0880_02581 [Yokenella regensburgei ATCC 43003]